MKQSVNREIARFNTQEYMVLYRHLKTFTLLNQLYNSDSITKQQLEKEQQQTLSKFNRSKQTLNEKDLQLFIELYGLQNQFKRMKNSKKDEIQGISISLAYKFIQIMDIISLQRENLRAKPMLEQLNDLSILLNKYQKRKSNINENFSNLIKKINQIQGKLKSKDLQSILDKFEVYDIQGTIEKMKLQFQYHA